MAEWWEWTGEPGPWESNAAPDVWAGGSPTFNEAGGDSFTTALPIRHLLAGAIRLALAPVAIRTARRGLLGLALAVLAHWHWLACSAVLAVA